MKATAHFLFVLAILLVFTRCQTTSHEDAGQANADVPKADAVAPGPDLVVADAIHAPDAATDMMLPDAAAGGPELGKEDAAATADLHAQDLAFDAPPSDLAPDLAASADLVARDLRPDGTLAAPDSARDTTSASSDSSLAAFCTGGAPRVVVNGTQSTPTVTGQAIAYDCCSGGEFQVTAAALDQPMVVAWQAQKGSFSGYQTIDLANPPSGWAVRVKVGCVSETKDCLEAQSYLGGLVGSLNVSDGKRGTYDMSLCLHLDESISGDRSILPTLDLFAPHITTIN